jgi:hypothetical protein
MAGATIRVVSKKDPGQFFMVGMSGGKTGNWKVDPPGSLDRAYGYFRCADAKPCLFFRSKSPGGPGNPEPVEPPDDMALMAFRAFSFPPDPNGSGTGWKKGGGNFPSGELTWMVEGVRASTDSDDGGDVDSDAASDDGGGDDAG